MVTVTSLDQYKSKISFGGGDNDAAVIGGVNTALLGKNWTVHDALANTSGTQAAAFGSTLVGGNATGLANNATVYAATITVDGVATPISIAGNVAQTFTTLINEINTDLAAAAVASLVGSTILVTSASTGLTSTISMVDAPVFGVSLPLFASVSGFARFNSPVNGILGKTYTTAVDGGAASGYQEVNVGGAKVAGSASGLTNSAAALYKATITVDGVATPISIAGNAAQTYGTVLSELNTDLGASAVASLINGNIRVTSATTGVNSTIAILDTPATFGSQTVNVGGNKTGASATNLVTDTAGFDTVTFTAPPVGGGATGLAVDTSGYQVVDTGGGHVGGDATGLTNDGTDYTADVVIDSVTYPVSAIGSANQTYTLLLGTINAAIGANGLAAIVSGNIRVTSSSTGISSTVAITDTGANHLFASLTGFVAIDAAVDGTTTNYTATITIDATGYPVIANGETNQTFTLLLATIQAAIGAFGTVAIVGSTIKITSATTGTGSTVAIVDTGANHLFDNLTNWMSTDAGTPGTTTDYTATITINGTGYPVTANGQTNQTYTLLIATLQAAVGVNGTVGLVGGNVKVTAAGTPGVASIVAITAGTLFAAPLNGFVAVLAAVNGTSPVFASLTGYVAVNTAVAGVGASTFGGYQNVFVAGNKIGSSLTGLSDETAGRQDVVFVYQKVASDFTGLANDATAYTADITVDGVVTPISVVGSTAQIFTDILSGINTDLGVAATATLFNGILRVTSATTGVSSTVEIADSGAHPLFASIANYYLVAPAVAGTAQAYTFQVLFDNGVINGYQVVNVGANKVSSSLTNLVGVTTYTATVTVDGVGHPVSILGSTAQTYGELVAQIEADLAHTAVVGLSGGNIRIESVSTGSVSTVAITAGTLFAAPLNGFVGLVAAIPGVVIDVSVAGSVSQTYTALLAAINVDLGASGVATLNNGNVRITSATTGPTSAVVIRNAGTLFATGSALTDCTGPGPSVPGAAVTPVTKYYVVATVEDGKFSYQRWTTWDAGLHTGTLPGPLFGFSRNPLHAGAIYMYSDYDVSNLESLTFA